MSTEDLVRRALTDHARDVSVAPDVEALVARGTQARRRRTLAIVASIAATVVIGVIVVGPLLRSTTGLAPVVGTPSPSSSIGPTTTAGPSAGAGFFAGSANVPVAFTVPAGWEVVENIFVTKSGADPAFGVAFYDVANLYADGCRWALLKPPVGPTVDDLVTAYGKIPELRAAAARPVTVDGFQGKQLQFTVPDYEPNTCQDDTFALLQADNAGTNKAQGGVPNSWALAPNQQNRALILDVDGTRLVIFTRYPPDISAADRADLDAIVRSVQIG